MRARSQSTFRFTMALTALAVAAIPAGSWPTFTLASIGALLCFFGPDLEGLPS